jgi:hypothetical protein
VVCLILAFGSFADAWHQYQDNQRLTRGASSSLWLGLVSTLATMLFFGVQLGIYWPVLFIIAGLALLSVGLIPA